MTMRKLLAAIRVALKAFTTSFRWVLRTTATGVQRIIEAIPSFGGGAALPQALDDENVAEAAAQDERGNQDAEAAEAELGAQCQALRRCAAARAENRPIPPGDAARLAPATATWLFSLRPDEAAMIAAGGLEGLRMRRALVESGYTKVPAGVRSPAQVGVDVVARLPSTDKRTANELEARIRRRRLGLPDDASDANQDYACGYFEKDACIKIRRVA